MKSCKRHREGYVHGVNAALAGECMAEDGVGVVCDQVATALRGLLQTLLVGVRCGGVMGLLPGRDG